MEDRVARLESRVAYLSDRVATLEERLEGIERGAPAARPAVEPAASLAEIVGLPATPLQQWLGMVGRTLVILGGAYLLRALTGSQVLPATVGVAAGLLYGAPWLLLASSAAARGSHLDAFSHALTTALIGFPLVWEATLRFKALTPAQSALLLGALTAAAMALASARHLHALAGVVTFGALASALGLAMATGEWTPYTVLAIALGVATLWLGYLREWTFLRWPAAFVANAMLLVVTGRAAVAGSARGALAVQLLMLVAYLGSFAIRTLVIGRVVIPFEVVQSIGVLAVAFGGAIVLIRSTGAGVVLFGIASLVLAAGGYLVAFAFVERRRHAKNFFFYALLALLFAVVGVALCAPAPLAAAIYAVTGVAAAWLARRYHRLTIALHAAVYVLAAAVGSGLLTAATLSIVAPAASAVTTPTALGALALLALAFTLFPVKAPMEPWGLLGTIPRVVVVATLAWTATGEVVGLALAAMAGTGTIDPSVLATLRTTVLVASTLALAAAAGRPEGREAGWLVYPLIVTIGLKLLFVDFPGGRPETLFVALAAYGCALIAAPRLMRRAEPLQPAPPARQA